MSTPITFAPPDDIGQFLSYDPFSGQFTWLRDWHRAIAGEVAGKINNKGYRVIKFRGREYPAHRLAWFYVHGELPKRSLDHRDCDKLNNSISNLRLATQSQNSANTFGRGPYLKGVSANPSETRFKAEINCNGRRLKLGAFATEAEANAAYLGAARVLFGDFARAR